MKNSVIAFLAVLSVLFLGAKALAIHETIPAETISVLPSTQDPEAVYTYIKVLEPYSEWRLWPGKKRRYKGSHHQGLYFTTYINTTASRAIKYGEPMQPGAIIVAENYTSDKKLAAITVMYKVKGFNPAAGDWFWAEYESGGKVNQAGKVQGCIDCHVAKKANDFIMTEDLKK